MISDVSPSGPGSRAGSPGGVEPSGSSCAAWYPKFRMAFTSAMAAATCFSSSPPTAPGRGETGEGCSGAAERSEEYTSELQSRPHLVCRLLLEQKKRIQLIVCHT